MLRGGGTLKIVALTRTMRNANYNLAQPTTSNSVIVSENANHPSTNFLLHISNRLTLKKVCPSLPTPFKCSNNAAKSFFFAKLNFCHILREKTKKKIGWNPIVFVGLYVSVFCNRGKSRLNDGRN